jgi:hypothetical protein
MVIFCGGARDVIIVIIIIIFIYIKSNTGQDMEKSIQNKQYILLSEYSYNSKIDAIK